MLRSLFAVALFVLAPSALAQEAVRAHANAHGAAGASAPTEPGQAAFAAIAEIAALLEADPATDWSKVDIAVLRRHLADMDNVTLRAAVAATPGPRGVSYTVTGAGPVRDSIRRMVHAHAATVNGRGRIGFAAADHPDGAVLTVTVADASMLQMIRGLGFFGLLTRGMHHRQHHLAIATGRAPHR